MKNVKPQVKNLKIVVVLYKKINKEIKIAKNNPIEIERFLLDFKKSLKLFSLTFNELNCSTSLIKPLPLPIFKNLFFLSLNISSSDIDLK